MESSSIRGLESLGQSQESFGSLLVPIILQKLPIEMRKHMTRERGKKSWDIRSLREAIAKEMYVEESNCAELNTDVDDYTPTASFVTGATYKSGKTNAKFSQPRSKYSPKKSNIKSCVFCNGTHYPSECTEYETPEKRFARIYQKCYVLIVSESIRSQNADLNLHAENANDDITLQFVMTIWRTASPKNIQKPLLIQSTKKKRRRMSQ